MPQAPPRTDRSAPPAPGNAHDRAALAAALRVGPVLLYDGVCGLCDRTVQWILRHDQNGPMRFATLQGPLGQAALAELPQLAGVDSVVLLQKNGATVRSTAALEILRYVGGIWQAGLVGYVLPRVIRDLAYNWIAARRYRYFGRFDACRIPSPESRSRFLD